MIQLIVSTFPVKSYLTSPSNFSLQNIELAPEVINASQILFVQPMNKSCSEHFELMQKQWIDNMERMRCLVDANVDPSIFIRACEYSIIKDTHKCEMAVREKNSFEIVTNASNIARRANRIIQVAAQEVENSEDKEYVKQITNASEALKLSNYSLADIKNKNSLFSKIA